MVRRRWRGLRSAAFRRTVFTLMLICLFGVGVWLGLQQTDHTQSKQLKLLQDKVQELEAQVKQLQQH
ncbi:MAG: hypothetical protein M0Z55_09185 [Peptococcaceae bacterium]|nr:hypothetical protein [Peptococcaceae bacterium]